MTESGSKIAVMPSLVVVVKSCFHLIPCTTQLFRSVRRAKRQILIQIPIQYGLFATDSFSYLIVDAPE